MGRVATATAIAERDDPSISSRNHRQPPEDGGEQNVQFLLRVLPLKTLPDSEVSRSLES